MAITIDGTGTISGVSATGLTTAQTVTQSAIATGVAGTGPAFSAYQSSVQTLSSVTNTKILFQTEEFDTNNNFANSTFTPTVAGYYQVSASIRVNSSSTTIRMMIWKNGSQYKIGTDVNTYVNNGLVTTLVYCNGTTDYIEAYALIGTGQVLAAEQASTWFNGSMTRAA